MAEIQASTLYSKSLIQNRYASEQQRITLIKGTCHLQQRSDILDGDMTTN